MTLLELLRLIRKSLALVIALPIIFALVTAGYAWLQMPNTYTASATVYVLARSDGSSNDLSSSDLSMSQMLANDIAKLIQSDRVREDAARALGMENLDGYKVSVDAGTSTRMINFSVTGESQQAVATIANQIAKTSDTVAKEAMDIQAINLINSAVEPQSPSGPPRLLYTLIALLVGLFVAIAIVVLKDAINTHLRTGEEASELSGVPVIGRIPRARKKQDPSSQSEIQNAIRTLAANVRFLSVVDPIQTIAVTSTIPNEGKSTTAYNLARALAADGALVLLVETDLRRSSLASMVKVRPTEGLYAMLSAGSNAASKRFISETFTDGLYFLGAEPNFPNPAGVLASEGFERAVDELCRSFDFIIFDTPPVGSFVDAAIIGSLTDATIMVVRPEEVRRDDFVNACDQLVTAKANIIGLCITFLKNETSDYYYAYYDADGKRVKRSKRKAKEAEDFERDVSEAMDSGFAAAKAATAEKVASTVEAVEAEAEAELETVTAEAETAAEATDKAETDKAEAESAAKADKIEAASAATAKADKTGAKSAANASANSDTASTVSAVSSLTGSMIPIIPGGTSGSKSPTPRLDRSRPLTVGSSVSLPTIDADGNTKTAGVSGEFVAAPVLPTNGEASTVTARKSRWGRHHQPKKTSER